MRALAFVAASFVLAGCAEASSKSLADPVSFAAFYPTRPSVDPVSFDLGSLPRASRHTAFLPAGAPAIDPGPRSIHLTLAEGESGGIEGKWTGWDAPRIIGDYLRLYSSCHPAQQGDPPGAIFPARWVSFEDASGGDVRIQVASGWFDPARCSGWVDTIVESGARRLLPDGSLYALVDCGPACARDDLVVLLPRARYASDADAMPSQGVTAFRIARIPIEEGGALTACVASRALADWLVATGQMSSADAMHAGERASDASEDILLGVEIAPSLGDGRVGIAYSARLVQHHAD